VKSAKIPLTKEERRLRRAERRAKQRLANAGRALKMRAARLAFEKLRHRAPAPPAPVPRTNIGCSGWFYWHWRDRFYSAGSSTSEWFAHYAWHFDTVELNAPFYSWPTVANVQSWVRQARGKRFIYTVKVCELITHVKKFVRTTVLVKDFYFIEQLLRPHMGCFLFQLPPSFHFTAARLKRIVNQLDPTRRNVVEFRHKSWWNSRVFRAFKKANIIFCSCSGPRLPDELVKTSDEIYVRFHGTKRWYRHDYAKDELAVWAKRIRECKPRRVWAYFNNDADGHAITNARELIRQLSKFGTGVSSSGSARRRYV
jgi:uncharacterized protein YecE (DUF72 family)